MTETAAIHIRGLRKTYGDHVAVDGLDLDVPRGECFALLGPNGAGKTTTVEILEGYRPRSGGEVSVLGLDPEQRASLRGLLSGLAGTVLISTHQTEDVSALCDRVLVIDAGAIRFDGTVPELLATAAGRVHLGPAATTGAVQTWKTGTGLVRSVGGQPAPDSSVVDPSVEDAYLLLRSGERTRQGVT